MLDEGHVDVSGKQCELHRAQLIESPPLPPAARGDRFAPYRRNFFAQRRILDLHQSRKKLRDIIHAVADYSGCHRDHLDFRRYFWGFEEVLSIIFRASRSSLTVSPYQLIFPANLFLRPSLRRRNNSAGVSSLFFNAAKIASLTVSYFCLVMFFPLLPSGCLVSVFSSLPSAVAFSITR